MKTSYCESQILLAKNCCIFPLSYTRNENKLFYENRLKNNSLMKTNSFQEKSNLKTNNKMKTNNLIKPKSTNTNFKTEPNCTKNKNYGYTND